MGFSFSKTVEERMLFLIFFVNDRESVIFSSEI